MNSILESSSALTIWQKHEDQEGRSVFNCSCTSIDFDNGRILLESQKAFELEQREVFFYSEQSKIIFKTSNFSFDEGILDITFPSELIVLSDRENEKYSQDNSFKKKIEGTTEHFTDESLSHESNREKINTTNLSGSVEAQVNLGGRLSGSIKTEKISTTQSAMLSTDKITTTQSVKSLSEDEMYEHKRAAPRARPKSQKRVTLHVKGNPDSSKEYELFDLSMGGLSFVISSRDLLKKNDLLEFTSFDDKPVDSLMIGIIRNIREEEMNRFRVGVQFISEE